MKCKIELNELVCLKGFHLRWREVSPLIGRLLPLSVTDKENLVEAKQIVKAVGQCNYHNEEVETSD